MNTLTKYRFYTVLWEIVFVLLVLLGLIFVLGGGILLIISILSVFEDATSDPSIRIIMVFGVIVPVSLLLIFLGIILPLNFSVKVLAAHYRVRLRKYEEYQGQHSKTKTYLASSSVHVNVEKGGTRGLFAWSIGIAEDGKAYLTSEMAHNLPKRPESWSTPVVAPDPRYIQWMRKREKIYYPFIILPLWLIVGIIVMTIKNQ